jgi:ribosomal protein L14E/L6E/L27E
MKKVKIVLSENLSIGQVVKSKLGRDQGNLFFIIKIVDEEYVLVADGDIRKLDKPKLKKVKHLKKSNAISKAVKNKIEANESINDAFLRAELKKLNLMA